jgi:hypothetical protein
MRKEMFNDHCFSNWLEDTPSATSKKTEGLKLNGTHQLIVCADVNLLSKNKNIIKKNTQAQSEAITEVRLEVTVHVSSPDYRTTS